MRPGNSGRSEIVSFDLSSDCNMLLTVAEGIRFSENDPCSYCAVEVSLVF